MGKNAQKKAIKKALVAKDETQLLIERLKPVAAEVLAIIGRHKGPMGGNETPAAEYEESYSLPAKEILEVYLRHDVRLGDTEFIKKLVMQGVEWPLNLVSSSLQRSVELAERKVFGSKMGELTFSRLDAVLKKVE